MAVQTCGVLCGNTLRQNLHASGAFDMISPTRRVFPYIAVALLAAATGWAFSFSTVEPADFTFINGTEPQSLDPALVSGQPEGRIIDAIFEGLYRVEPDFDEQAPPPDLPPAERPFVSMVPRPAVAESHTLSDDKLTYTFKIRPDVYWSNGEPVTAHDFEFSWQRFLHPETGSKYEYQLTSYVVNAERYYKSEVAVGDRVEVELDNRPRADQLFPRGSIVHGTLQEVIEGPAPKLPAKASKEQREEAVQKQQEQRIYVVRVKGEDRRYSKKPPKGDKSVVACKNVLLDFREVGIEAVDDSTFRVQLVNPTPYFLYLTAFYPLYPVNRGCVEQFGVPEWTSVENIVSNGPFVIQSRRIRDRIRLVKNPTYWDRETVQLTSVDALAVESSTTSLNMYMDNQVDWATTAPTSVIDDLKLRQDTVISAGLQTYYYRFNVNRPPLDNPKVRRALNMAVNKRLLVEAVLRAGQKPAFSFVPPGLPGYDVVGDDSFDPEQAKKLLAEAGYADGKGFPTVEILYNNAEGHRTIAEFILSQWQRHLGVTASLAQQAWGTYLDTVNQQKYVIARSGWIGDYPDPNTFLDMFVTDGANNQTGWSNARYDEIIRELAARESDPERRYQLLREAEVILMDEVPIMPLYFSININMVRPYVNGWFPNAQSSHPLSMLSIDKDLRERYRTGETDPVTGLLIEGNDDETSEHAPATSAEADVPEGDGG